LPAVWSGGSWAWPLPWPLLLWVLTLRWSRWRSRWRGKVRCIRWLRLHSQMMLWSGQGWGGGAAFSRTMWGVQGWSI
jgi:hypothetical protein